MKNSLRADWVDRIFARMQGVYGREFTGYYSIMDNATGIDIGLENAKVTWGEELATFQDWPEAIGYALERLPDRPPNVIKFRELCRQAPKKEDAKQLAYTPVRADWDTGRRAINNIKSSLAAFNHKDNLGWAKKILAEHEAGVPKTPAVLKMAKTALGA